MKTTEHELTFLLKKLPEGLQEARKAEMLDIYIPASAEHPIIRIRRIGNRMEITKKSPVGEDSSEQSEHTIPLTMDEFNELSKLGGKRITKTRFFLDVNGRTAEIDVFHGKLEGLALADFEFKTKEEKAGFRPPDFCLADVTQEEFIAGGMLCGKGYDDIKDKLASFGYQKINMKRC